jgi:hypothetical protein
MSHPLLDHETPPAAPRGLRWWLRVAEVRLRFVALLLVALAVVTQWTRLRNVWDHLWHVGGHVAASVSGDTEYFCPMDPGVLSQWPAICPICNMDLVPRRKHDAQILPEGVVARMQLSPYRVQLAGIRTAEVTRRPLAYEIPVAGTLTSGPDGLSFEAPVSPADVPLLAKGTAEATVSADGSPDAPATAALVGSPEDTMVKSISPTVRVTLAAKDAEGFAAGMVVRAAIRVPAGKSPNEPLLAVPESAVVDHGSQRLVFVESMPGQFDGVPVTLGRRCGDEYPVLSGLTEGQHVASAGAFLIDAETRLNPSLAVAYFGANQAGSPSSRAPEVRVAGKKSGTPALSAEDAALAAHQKVCPVTGLPLDSMGGPVLMTVEGRKVFLCCKGCEGKLKRDPAKYLAKLPAHH